MSDAQSILAAARPLSSDGDRRRKAEQEARERWLAENPEKVAAARLMGMRPTEIAAVQECRAGVVVTLTGSGPRWIVVPEDRPDAKGQTGVPQLDPPAPRYSSRVRGYVESELPAGVALYAPPEGMARFLPSPAKPRPPIVKPVAPRVERDDRSTLEREREKALAEDPTDEELAAVRRIVEQMESTIDPGAAAGERRRLVAQMRAPLMMLEGRRRAADSARAELANGGRPFASPDEVRRMVRIVAWCRPFLDAQTERERIEALEALGGHEAHPLPAAGYSPVVLRRELEAAVKFLADHGYDEDGAPLSESGGRA